MTKLTITFSKDLEMAKEILTKVQYAIYKNRLNALLKIIRKKLKAYKVEVDEPDKMVFSEEGDKEYIDKEKEKLQEFLFGESEDLINDPEIAKVKTDRIMHKLTTMIRKAKDSTKHKAINAALMGNNVIGFFTKMGIIVVWEVSD